MNAIGLFAIAIFFAGFGYWCGYMNGLLAGTIKERAKRDKEERLRYCPESIREENRRELINQLHRVNIKYRKDGANG